ncbi:glycosyltransferase FlmG [soil metagenome]
MPTPVIQNRPPRRRLADNLRASAGVVIAPDLAASPARARMSAGAAGESGASGALDRLNAAMAELKAQAVLPFIHQSLLFMRADDHRKGAEMALKALEIDERCGIGWHLLAICREKAGDFTGSLKCYETALELCPDEPEIANDLGRLAYAMGMKDTAEQLFAHYLRRKPDQPEGVNNLACAQRDQLRFAESIETLRPAIEAHPEHPLLWNTLGTILAEQGEMAGSVTFFDEALRLDPAFAKARYNLANAKLALGDAPGALADCEAAIPGVVLGSEVAMMKLARSTMLLASGRLGEGWDAYEVRLDPDFADVTHFLIDAPQWTPEQPLQGKKLLLVGEQGLGDEVLFANVVPDVIEALGRSGRLSLAVEPRLVALFQRSFPQARVGSHATFRVDHHTVRTAPFAKTNPKTPRADRIDAYAPLAAPLRRFRRDVESYPDTRAFLTADPEQVARWTAELAALGPEPKVGVVWKSLKVDSGRHRFYSPFEDWAPVLRTPGVRFVNLQYGDCAEELAEAKRRFGVEIWSPPGLDLRADLDGVCALSGALDLVIGPANAATNLSAACGAPTWLVSTPGAWPRLGTDRYPWYPSVRVFTPSNYNDWAPVMQDVASALAALTAS